MEQQNIFKLKADSKKERPYESGRNAINLVIIILLAGLIITYIVFYCTRLVAFSDFPAEVRDPAVAQVVNLFAQGINPYDAAYLSTDEAPRVLLDSGFFNVFPAVLLVKLFHFLPLFSLYFMNLIYIVLAAALIYLLVWKLTKEHVLSLTAAFLELFCMRRSVLLVARPDTLAEVLLLLILYIFLTSIYLQREWTWQLPVTALLCVLIAFLKVHYATVALSILVFLAIRDRRKAFMFILWTFLAGVLITLAVYILYPTHLSVWIVRLYEMFISVARKNSISTIMYVAGKWKKLFIMFMPVFLITGFGFCAGIISSIRERSRGSKPADVSSMRLVDRFLIINIVINVFALLLLGKHDGASLWYFFYMLMPSMFLYASLFIKYKTANLKIGHLLRAAFSIACIIAIMGEGAVVLKQQQQISRIEESHQEAYAVIEKYASAEMFLTSQLSVYAIDRNIYNFDYGDTCFIPSTRILNEHLEKLLPYTNSIEDKYNGYWSTVLQKIEDKEYSLFTINESFSIPSLPDDCITALEENYRIVQEIKVYSDKQVSNICFMIPKS